MCRYSWPGNVRELENAVARAVVLGADEAIGPEHFPLPVDDRDSLPTSQTTSYHEALDRYSRRIIEQALRKANWSQTHVAELLQLQRTYLVRLMKQKDIQPSPPSD